MDNRSVLTNLFRNVVVVRFLETRCRKKPHPPTILSKTYRSRYCVYLRIYNEASESLSWVSSRVLSNSIFYSMKFFFYPVEGVPVPTMSRTWWNHFHVIEFPTFRTRWRLLIEYYIECKYSMMTLLVFFSFTQSYRILEYNII